MSVAQCRLAACVLTAALSSAAVAQEKPAGPAPDSPGAARGPSQDLEPSVDTSATPNETESHPKRSPHATPAPQAAAKPAAQAPADRGESKPKGNAKDRIELDPTQITGNRELPKVLYIVPWKHSDLSDLGGRPTNSLLDEVLTPVDRDVFKRENRYYGALQPDEPRPGGRAPGAPPAAGAASEAAQAPPARDEK
jgi:hypothetical protein